MPKAGASSSYESSGRRERGSSPHQTRQARSSKPYGAGRGHSAKCTEAQMKFQAMWDEVSCSICMESPHNAVLLVCEQHEKGCTPYMCDTSHRHSNCLDQFRKTCKAESTGADEMPAGNARASGANGHLIVVSALEGQTSVDMLRLGPVGRLDQINHMRRNLAVSMRSQEQGIGGNSTLHWQHDETALSHPAVHGDGGVLRDQEGSTVLQRHGEVTEQRNGSVGLTGTEAEPFAEGNRGEGVGEDVATTERNHLLEKVKAMGESFIQAEAGLLCPLCRSRVLGWKVAKEARTYLNQKHRTCSRENCGFTGTYATLRNHAREVHPLARPQEADPTRVAQWRRLQHQQEREDVMSTIRSLMPGARVYGDYLIEDDIDLDMDAINESDSDDMAGPDLDLILPMLEAMRGLATSGPSYQQGRLPWSFGLGPRPIRRRALAGRNRSRIGSSSFSASLPPPVNLHVDRGEPPPFPDLPPVPLRGAMPSGDPIDDVVPRRSRWGEISEWREQGRNVVGHDSGAAEVPELWAPGAGESLQRELLDRRRLLVAEAIRGRLRRGREEPNHQHLFD